MNDQKQPTSVLPARKRTPYARSVILCTALLVLAVSGALFLLRSPATAEATAAAASAPPPMPVEVTEVAVAAADEEVVAVGTLQSNESVLISAEIAGRIDAIAFAEGEVVARGKELIRLDASVLRAEFDRAEATRALSEANCRRAEALLAEKAIAQRERDEAYARWQYDEASVRLARAQWDKTRIAAPFAGTLGLRQVSAGDYVQPGEALVNLEDISRLKVEFRIPERFSAQVKTGQKVRLQADAFPGREFVGSVYAIDPQVEADSRSGKPRRRPAAGAVRQGGAGGGDPGRRPLRSRAGPHLPAESPVRLQGGRRGGADGAGGDGDAPQGVGRGDRRIGRGGRGGHRRPPEDRPGKPGAPPSGRPGAVRRPPLTFRRDNLFTRLPPRPLRTLHPQG